MAAAFFTPLSDYTNEAERQACSVAYCEDLKFTVVKTRVAIADSRALMMRVDAILRRGDSPII